MSESQKADQIAFHFYTKLFNVVSHARSTNPPAAKLDKWFNLETPDSELFTKEARERYRSISVSPPPPPLEIQVLLTIPELTHNQVLVHVSPDSSRVRIDPTPRYVLLEEFILHFIPAHTPADVPLPTIYKHGIPLFRSLFTLLRLLPVWKLHKRLRRRIGTGPSLGITLRVRQGTHDDIDVLSLMTTAQADTHTFPSVPHPLGSLALSATYLTHPTFQLDDLESLLSSRFLSLDKRPFTPTLAAKNHLRSSSTTTTSSSSSPPGPHSHSLSRSPPRAGISQAQSHSSTGIPLPLPDRGNPRLPLTPPRLNTSRPASGPASAQPILSGLSSTRLAHLSTGPATATGATQHGVSSTSSLSPTNSFFAGNPASGGAPIPETIPSSTSNPSNTASPAATRPPSRPQPQYPFPFKSNTVAGGNNVGSIGSSSSSPGGLALGLPSSLGSTGSGGIPSSVGDRPGLGLGRYGERDRVVSLPHHPAGDPTLIRSGAGSRMGVHSRGSSVSVSTGPVGVGAGFPMSRTTSAKGRERDDGDHIPGTSVTRKRYSSSFGHRYGSPQTGVIIGSLGSTSSGDKDGPASQRDKDDREDRRRSIPTLPPQHQHNPHSHSPLSPHYSPSSSQMFLRAGSADDEEISVFVQDIDARKMLRGASRAGSREVSRERGAERELPKTSPLGHEYESDHRPPPVHLQRRVPLREREREELGEREVNVPLTSTSTSPQQAGLMLTSEREVDERLRRMNEVFWGSLEGLGGASSGKQERSRANNGHGNVSAGGSRGHSRSASLVGMGGAGVEPEIRFRSRIPSLSGQSPTTSTSSGSTITQGTIRGSHAPPSQGIAIPIPHSFRRQGSSQEVVGRMEAEAEAESEEWAAGAGRGVRSGGRYYMF